MSVTPKIELHINAYTGHGGPFRDFAEADLGPSEVAASVADQQLDLVRGRLLLWIAGQLEFVAIG